MAKMLRMGQLGDAFGIQGWLHLFSNATPSENLFTYHPLFIDSKPIEITHHKPHGNHFVVKIKNCDDRDQALLLKNKAIFVERDALPDIDEGYYWDDLIGFTVVTTHHKTLGTIDHLFSAGANDVIAIKGEKLQYVPYLPDVVLAVDLEKKVMTVDWEELI